MSRFFVPRAFWLQSPAECPEDRPWCARLPSHAKAVSFSPQWKSRFRSQTIPRSARPHATAAIAADRYPCLHAPEKTAIFGSKSLTCFCTLSASPFAHIGRIRNHKVKCVHPHILQADQTSVSILANPGQDARHLPVPFPGLHRKCHRHEFQPAEAPWPMPARYSRNPCQHPRS